MSWFSYRPYVPVAARRAQGRRELEKLQAKGHVIEPLGALTHRSKIATSFWGASWCQHLEAFSDYENRLPRGRTYVRHGTITALVQGSDLYRQTIQVSPLPPKNWKSLQSRCGGRIGSLIELLQGRISGEIMGIVTDPSDGLFPKPREITFSCSCPDWASMCKHIAAVLYGVGARLDSRPELLFTLRGVDHHDLIATAGADATLGASAPTTGSRRRTLDPAHLVDVFGIDLDPEPTPARTTNTRKPRAPLNTAKAVASRTTARSSRRQTASFTATADSVRALRESLDLTRAAFAAILGVSTQSITNWETKRGPLKLHAASLEALKTLHSLQPQASGGK